MRNLVRYSAAALFLAAAGLATADDPAKPAAKPVTDSEFVIMAASGGMFEVESSKLAKAQSTDAAVKKFAEEMITDHTKANMELKDAAAKAGQGIPLKMLDHHQKMLEKLQAAKGADFDTAYKMSQVKSHEEAVALFSGATKGVKDPGLKAFAEKTLPVVKKHLDHAKMMHKGGKAG